MNKNTVITTLRELFTPTYDRTIGVTYTGNHSSYQVTFERVGDEITIRHYGAKGRGPVRPLIEIEFYNIPAFITKMEKVTGHPLKVVWDIPEGVSFADDPKKIDGKAPVTCLKPGDRFVDDIGFIQEIVSISPYSTWGLKIETTYSRDHGGMKMVLDKNVSIEVTFDEPHGPDNPHQG